MDNVVNQAKEEDKKLKKTEELTKAVMALTDRFKKNEELAKKKGIVGAVQRGTQGFMESAKEKMSDMFSVKGVAGMLGFKPGGMIMNLLGARHEDKKAEKAAKAEEANKAKLHAENYVKYNVEGQKLAETDPKAALAAGVKNYEEVKKKEAEIEQLKERIAQAEKTGHGDIAKEMHGTGIEALELERKSALSGKKESYFDAPKTGFKAKPKAQSTPVEKPAEPAYKGNQDIIESLIALGYTKQEANTAAQALPEDIGVSDGIKAAMKSLSKEPDKSKTGTPAPAVAKPSSTTSVTTNNTTDTTAPATLGGADTPDEELIELNKKQLEALNKLVKAETKTEEDKLEEKNKDKPGMPDTKKSDKKEEKKEEKKGIFDGLLEGLSNMFSGIVEKFSNILKLAGVAKEFLGSTVGKVANIATKVGGFAASALEAVGGGSALGGAATLALAAAPMAAMYGVTKWAEKASIKDENGEMTGTGKVVEGTQKALGGRGLTADADKSAVTRLDEATSSTSTLGISSDLFGTKKKANIKKYTDSFELGSQYSAEEAAVLKKNLGIDVPAQNIKKPQSDVTPTTSADGKTATGAMPTSTPLPATGAGGGRGSVNPTTVNTSDNSTETSNTVTVSPEMSKPTTTSREAQSAQLERAQKQAERIEREKADAATKSAPASAVVNNNTSVNNNTTVTKLSAPVRNFEPSFNRRLDYAFGGGIATVGVRG